MSTAKRVSTIIIAIALVFGTMGFGLGVQPAQAATCVQYHTVWYGQTLYQIGLMYGVSWVYVGQINGIPNPNRIFAGQVLCVRLSDFGTGGPGVPGTGGPWPWFGPVPTFSIVNIVPGTSVTVQTQNFPANDTFNAYMGPYGSLGIGGIFVGSVTSGAGGSQTYTFSIPPALAGAYQIALRLQSPTSGYYAYNWFYNTAGGTGGPVVPPGPMPGPIYYGIPSFMISAAQRNTSVTVFTNNFPANDTFNCYMGLYGSGGVGGVPCGTVSSGAGGSMAFTFSIPAQLFNQARIAIRLQSPTSGYFAFNWFWNTSTY